MVGVRTLLAFPSPFSFSMPLLALFYLPLAGEYIYIY